MTRLHFQWEQVRRSNLLGRQVTTALYAVITGSWQNGGWELVTHCVIDGHRYEHRDTVPHEPSPRRIQLHRQTACAEILRAERSYQAQHVELIEHRED